MITFYELLPDKSTIVKHNLPSWIEALAMLEEGRVIALSEYDIVMELYQCRHNVSTVEGFIPPTHYVIEGHPCEFIAFEGWRMCYSPEDDHDEGYYLALTEQGLVQVTLDTTSFNFNFPLDKAEQ